MKTCEERKRVRRGKNFCILFARKFHVNLSFVTKPTDHHQRDGVLEYANELMTLGMLFINYKDAVQEGDGFSLWKHLLPIFRFSGRKNYSDIIF